MFKKIYIEITNVCNLKCEFCPTTKRKKEYMTVQNFEKIINKVHNYTNLVCLHVKGEPLLHEQLNDILKILEKYNLKSNITTNGTLIKEKLNVIKNSKAVRQINFSIHSLMQNKILDSNYLTDIFKSVEQLDNIIISYRLWDAPKNINQDIIKEIENYYNIDNLIEKISVKNFLQLKNNIFINVDGEFTWPDISGSVIIEKGRCLALKDQIAILVDGTVVPCCLDNNGDIPLGNILNETLEDIINKTYTKQIEENFKNNVITCELCKTCGFLKRLENKRKNRIEGEKV